MKIAFFAGNVSIGAGSDSFYEYLLKSWIQTGNFSARQLYDDAMISVLRAGLFGVSQPSYLMYVGERDVNGKVAARFSHLACFVGGMLALGAATNPVNSTGFDGLGFGANITNTCRESYARSATGLGKHCRIYVWISLINFTRQLSRVQLQVSRECAKFCSFYCVF